MTDPRVKQLAKRAEDLSLAITDLFTEQKATFSEGAAAIVNLMAAMACSQSDGGLEKAHEFLAGLNVAVEQLVRIKLANAALDGVFSNDAA